MSRRLLPTLVDYVVVAINPALIMGLIGSLVYFLLEVFYAGQYPDKLQFALSSFVFASVLVSRIAIESGSQHAAPFGMALAVVVGIALNTFVDYRGAVVGYFAWIINWGLMALIWWCADKLTWDCTVIDENEEAAGRGLLETVGIDPAAGVSDEDATKPVVDKPADAAVPPVEPSRTRWQDLLDPPARPHTPGVWIVYFSLASLPIFGFGQAFIPASRVAGRRYAFLLLCVYVACGLALLLTTSFLSIRRYLRQRRLEMPLTMVGNWLSTGAVMIVVLLLLAALLPRPSPEFAISEVPWQAKSEQHEASKVSFGSEGVRDPNAAPDSGVDHSTDQPAGQQSGGVDTKGPAGQTVHSVETRAGQFVGRATGAKFVRFAGWLEIVERRRQIRQPIDAKSAIAGPVVGESNCGAKPAAGSAAAARPEPGQITGPIAAAGETGRPKQSAGRNPTPDENARAPLGRPVAAAAEFLLDPPKPAGPAEMALLCRGDLWSDLRHLGLPRGAGGDPGGLDRSVSPVLAGAVQRPAF